MWDCPYSSRDPRAEAAVENRKKVQRRREEAMFVKGIRENAKLSHMADVREQIESERTLRAQQLMAPKPQPPPPPPAPPSINCVSAFDADVTCIEATHGGATLWTAEKDGKIGIRNGVTGKLVYVIEKTEDAFVTVLHSTEAHVWVGLSDGTIRVYDHLVYILAFENKLHTKAISCFATTFDGKMFSAGADSAICKWDSESNNFEIITQIEGNSQPITCMTCYGYNLFAGGTTGLIQAFDSETAAEIHVFEGHEKTVNVIVVSDGYLFSGGEDGKVFVWSIGTAQPIQVLEWSQGGIVSLLPDSVGHRMWVCDVSGAIHIFETTTFTVLDTITIGANIKKFGLKGIVAIDAIKVWSTGSNGFNKIWHAASNKIELSVSSAVQAMNSIIEEDALEIAKWHELIRTMEAVADKLQRSTSTTLTISTVHSVQRRYYFHWLQWLLLHYAQKKRAILTRALERKNARTVQHTYWCKLRKYLEEKKDFRRKTALATAGINSENRRLINAYWTKAQTVYFFVRRKVRSIQIGEAFQRNTISRIQKDYLSVWMKFRAKQRRNRKKGHIAAALAHANMMVHLRVAYWAWKQCLHHRKNLRTGGVLAIIRCKEAEFALFSKYFVMWARWSMKRRCVHHKIVAALAMQKQTENDLLASSYGKLQRYAVEQRDARQEQEFDRNEARLKDLRSQLAAIQHLVHRRKLLDEAQAMINAAVSERVKKQLKIAEIEEECKGLRAAIEVKKSGARERQQKSLQEQVADLIGQLKCKVLNLHHDYVLISKMLDRSKHVGVLKVFLEAHMAVKRVVVELTHETYLNADQVWPLSEALIKSMKGHHIEAVLTAIKTMVISFDVMTPVERLGLTTDNEIVINARWLEFFSEWCVTVKAKRLGQATAFRVK